MEDNAQDDQSFSESMWLDFSSELDSSTLAEMERISEEANHDNEVVTGEANHENEVVFVDVTEEVPNAHEVVILVTDEFASMNEVVILADAQDVISVNEVVISEGTDEANSVSAEEASKCRQIESPGEKALVVKMRHFLSKEQYLFVEDLIQAVKETRNEWKESSTKLKRQLKQDPNPCVLYFSAENKFSVQSYVYSNEKDFISLINESMPTSSFCVFETCKARFIEKYKPEKYEEKEFMNFCAAIAYLGLHCSARRLDPNAEIKATNYICSLLYDLIQRGTL